MPAETPSALKLPRRVMGWSHGTNSGYTYGCRCTPCVEARRRYNKLWKATAKQRGIYNGIQRGKPVTAKIIQLEEVPLAAQGTIRRKFNACNHARLLLNPSTKVIECRDCHKEWRDFLGEAERNHISMTSHNEIQRNHKRA